MWSTYYQEIYVKQECPWEPMMLTVIGCLQVGWPLSFFTLGIEYHHIHHLNPGVPAYRLQDCHNAAKHLFQLVPRVTLRSFLGCDFVLWHGAGGNLDPNQYSILTVAVTRIAVQPQVHVFCTVQRGHRAVRERILQKEKILVGIWLKIMIEYIIVMFY